MDFSENSKEAAGWRQTHSDPCRHSSEGRNPRLQGCTPAWMQVVERRLEQAAEVVERRLEQAAEEGGFAVLNE